VSGTSFRLADLWTLYFFAYLYFSSILMQYSRVIGMLAFAIILLGLTAKNFSIGRFERLYGDLGGRRIIFSSIIFVSFQLFTLFNRARIEDLYNVILAIGSVYIFWISITFGHKQFNNLLIRLFLGGWLLLMVSLSVAVDGISFSSSRDAFFYPHRNVVAFLGMATIFFLIYSVKSKPIKLIIILLGLFLLVRQDSRGVFICCIVVIFSYQFRSVIFRNRWLARSVFMLSLIIIAGFTAFMTSGMSTNELYWLDSMVREYSGGGINSGRQLIWPDIMTRIMARPWWGYGAGEVPSMFMETEWSSHSIYLQSALQTGFIGLSVLVLFLYQIYMVAVNSRSYIAASLIIGILFHQMFNVSLFQNNYEQGILMLLAIGATMNINGKDIASAI
jgi:O-antigen ligase